MTYYHGTSKTSSAKGIIADGGLDPAATNIKYAGRGETALRPAGGKVYITQDLRYAIVYAINGDMLGTDYFERYPPKAGEEYAFIFTFDDKVVKEENSYPDEDNIGEILHYYYFKVDTNPHFDMSKVKEPWFKDLVALAEKKLTKPQLSALKEKYTDYAWYAKAGKKLMPFLTPEMRKGLISMGTHVAHEGKLKYAKVYSFDKKLTSKLKKDGSNFFDLAKLVRKGSKVLESSGIKSFSDYLTECDNSGKTLVTNKTQTYKVFKL